MKFPDIIVAADEVVAALDGQSIHAVTLHEREHNGVYTHIQVQLFDLPDYTTRGALLEIAMDSGLTEVDLDADPRRNRVRGMHGEASVELFA